METAYLIIQMTELNRKAPSFLLKTYQILTNAHFNDIITWCEDGAGFMIVNAKRFATEILPNYFKHCNMSSFIRQLNMYGFTKPRDAQGRSFYYQEHFNRDSMENIARIQRKTESKLKCKKEVSSEHETAVKTQIAMLFYLNESLLNEQISNLHLLCDQLQDPNPRLRDNIDKYVAVHRSVLHTLEIDARKVLSFDISQTMTHASIRDKEE